MPGARACRNVFSATAAGAFLFVLRNSLGTSNVPNFACRAKTLWSCKRSETRAYRVLLCIWDGKRCNDVWMGARYVSRWAGSKMVRAEMGREGRER